MALNTYFVDREEEISTILGFIKARANVLIYGLRGIGKTTLLEKVHDILIHEGRKVLYIDGYEILSPEDLFVISRRTPTMDARDSVRFIFEMLDHVIIIDEFTSLIQMLARYRPFGNVEDVVKYIRSQTQLRRKRGGESIIISSSALGFIKRATMKYFAPLFREFKLLFIGPMSFEAIYELAIKHGIKEEEAREIAELSTGNPFYARKIIEQVIAQGISPREALFKLIESKGDLDIYFTALMENLQAEERYILHLIARGRNRFYEIEEKLYKDPSPYLKRLEDNGLVLKIKKTRKFSQYIIPDKVFQAWLLSQEIPSLGKISREAIYVSSLGFEALVRELLRSITSVIKIRDWLGQSLELPPFRAVYNVSGHDYEIDAVGLRNNEAYVFEIHFWGKARYNKVLQLIKNAELFAKDYGKRIKEKVLISYFGCELTNKEKEKIKEQGIKLLTSKELREIQKKTGVKLGF